MNDPNRARRTLWCQHWQEFSRLHTHYEANDVDYRQREYPPFPEETRGLTCGAKCKRTGQPCTIEIYLRHYQSWLDWCCVGDCEIGYKDRGRIKWKSN
jgi:hypothetical protein